MCKIIGFLFHVDILNLFPLRYILIVYKCLFTTKIRRAKKTEITLPSRSYLERQLQKKKMEKRSTNKCNKLDFTLDIEMYCMSKYSRVFHSIYNLIASFRFQWDPARVNNNEIVITVRYMYTTTTYLSAC